MFSAPTIQRRYIIFGYMYMVLYYFCSPWLKRCRCKQPKQNMLIPIRVVNIQPLGSYTQQTRAADAWPDQRWSNTDPNHEATYRVC